MAEEDIFLNQAQGVQKLSETLVELSKNLGESTRFLENMEKSFRRQKESDVLLKSLNDTSKEFHTTLKKQNEIYKKIKKRMEEYGEEIEDIDEKTETLSESSKSLSKSLRSFKKSVGGVIGVTKSWLPLFGAQVISVQSANEAVLEYRKGVFDLSRTLSVSGQEYKDLETSIDAVTKVSTLSSNEFLKFADAAMKTWKYTKPGIGVITNLATVLDKKLGHSLEASIELLNHLGSIMNDLPITANRMAEVIANGTREQKEAMMEEIKTMVLLGKVGADSYYSIQKSLKPLTEDEKKQKELIKDRQNAIKSFKEAILDLGITLEPIIKKVTKIVGEIVNKTKDFLPTLLIMGTSWKAISAIGFKNITNMFSLINTATKGTNIASLVKNFKILSALKFTAINSLKVLLPLVAAGAVGFGIGKLADELTKLAFGMKASDYFGRKMAGGLSDEFYKARKKTKEYRKEREKLQKTGKWPKKEEKDALFSTIKQLETIIEISKQIQSNFAKNIEIMKNFGELELSTSMSNFARQIEEANSQLANLATYSNMLAKEKNYNIGINFETASTGDINKEIATLQQQKASTKDLAEKTKLENTLQLLTNFRTKKLETEYQKITMIVNKTKDWVDASANANAVYEEQISLQKELMEAAQFGMGASLEMMQKQVEMHQEMIKLREKSISQYDEDINKQLQMKGLSEDRIQGLKKELQGAIGIEQRKAILARYDIKEGSERQTILGLMDAKTQSQNEILKRQKAIYDVTKDVREGYLDAIREMSVGAGEFAKIIGTQTMGATQLMKAVDNLNKKGTQGMLNTFGMGGMQNKKQTEAGVGTQAAAKYVGGILQVQSKSAQEAENQRIYNFGIKPNAKNSQIGSSAVLKNDKMMGVAREQGMTRQLGKLSDGNINTQRAYDFSRNVMEKQHKNFPQATNPTSLPTTDYIGTGAEGDGKKLKVEILLGEGIIANVKENSEIITSISKIAASQRAFA